MRFIFLLLCFFILNLSSAQLLTRYETSGGTETFTYEEGIAFCKKLSDSSPYLKLFEYGKTDAGFPLHALVFDASKNFDPLTEKEVVLINNAIHPGEPDGVEASLMMLRDLAANDTLRLKFSAVRLVVIPFYNIGGALNRNSHSRANQVGPEAYGFRGNAKNYDLNRDFIKADAKNTFALYQIFHTWKPHVFMDTHVSNGADYQYTMTLIHSQNEKYEAQTARFIEQFFIPALYSEMDRSGFEMTPYVNVHGTVPDSGFTAFMETPRYSNGYTSLWDCISLVSETHMLKPFDQRVKATYTLIDKVMTLTASMHPSRSIAKDKEMRKMMVGKVPQLITVEWQRVNYSPNIKGSPFQFPDSILFKGYQAGYKKSEVSGLPRLYYDRTKPFEKRIPYHDKFQAKTVLKSVKAYYLPRQWQEVADRLRANQVELVELQKDSLVVAEVMRIDSFGTSQEAYEGHYLHSGTKVISFQDSVLLKKGSYLIYPNEDNLKFLTHVLEPSAPDSYFNWNFFDPILQQKEWFSAYVFEDIAADLLKKDPELRRLFERVKKNNPDFAASSFDQLYFIYQRSPYYEKSHLRYPVLRIGSY